MVRPTLSQTFRPPALDAVDAVREVNECRLMRNHEHRDAAAQTVDARADRGFRFRVERRRGLIEDEKGRTAYQGPGDRQALPLSTREAGTAFPELGLDSAGQGLDKIQGSGCAQGVLDGVVRDRGVAEAHIRGHAFPEERDVLRDIADLAAPGAQVRLREREVVDPHLPAARSHQAQHEIGDTRFPGPRHPHQGRDLARRNPQRSVLEDRLIVVDQIDVTDFATPVQLVDAVQDGDHVVFTISATGNYDYLTYQADQVLSIDVTPLTDDEVERRTDIFKYSGEKLSLNFQDIEVRSVLQLIADFTDLNLVASDTVSGRITLRLKNVPWDQALELILKTKGLDQRQVGNVLLVAPAAEIAAREKLELENQKQISELAPLQTEFVQVRYASATELFGLFEGQGQDGESSILSARGSVIVDERTNSIIVTDTAAKLEEFRRVIAQLDIPVRQVLIEARIVTANATFSEELGIQWGGAAYDQQSSTRVLSFGGSQQTLSEIGDIIAGDDHEHQLPRSAGHRPWVLRVPARRASPLACLATTI